MKHRVDRFINLMEIQFDLKDTDLMANLYRLLKDGNVDFKDFLKPYIDSALDDPDLITRAIILHNHLVVRLNYRNGDSITSGFNKKDLEYLIEEFQDIVKSLQGEVVLLEEGGDKV